MSSAALSSSAVRRVATDFPAQEKTFLLKSCAFPCFSHIQLQEEGRAAGADRMWNVLGSNETPRHLEPLAFGAQQPRTVCWVTARLPAGAASNGTDAVLIRSSADADGGAVAEWAVATGTADGGVVLSLVAVGPHDVAECVAAARSKGCLHAGGTRSVACRVASNAQAKPPGGPLELLVASGGLHDGSVVLSTVTRASGNDFGDVVPLQRLFHGFCSAVVCVTPALCPSKRVDRLCFSPCGSVLLSTLFTGQILVVARDGREGGRWTVAFDVPPPPLNSGRLVRVAECERRTAEGGGTAPQSVNVAAVVWFAGVDADAAVWRLSAETAADPRGSPRVEWSRLAAGSLAWTALRDGLSHAAPRSAIEAKGGRGAHDSFLHQVSVVAAHAARMRGGRAEDSPSVVVALEVRHVSSRVMRTAVAVARVLNGRQLLPSRCIASAAASAVEEEANRRCVLWVEIGQGGNDSNLHFLGVTNAPVTTSLPRPVDGTICGLRGPSELLQPAVSLSALRAVLVTSTGTDSQPGFPNASPLQGCILLSSGGAACEL